jgi:hypothetical protein
MVNAAESPRPLSRFSRPEPHFFFQVAPHYPHKVEFSLLFPF